MSAPASLSPVHLVAAAWRVALLVLATMVLLGRPANAAPQRQREKLGRGLVAVRQGDGTVYVGWRLLGADPASLAFNLYRRTGGDKPVKRNDRPLTAATNFVDAGADFSRPNAYFVRPVLAGREQSPSASFVLPANAPARPYLSVALQTPPGYAPNDASVGDLDGDNEYDLVLHQSGRSHDNSQNGETDPPILQGYKLDGTLLWTINLGRNTREGAHYTQFLVYDLDGDNKAEVVCKTADGTRDGAGKVIGDANADWRDAAGRILTGPEFLTVFDGKTGRALATTNYVPARGRVADWGDGYGNRVDRFLACVAFLDGVRPSIVFCRGYYTRTVLVAWDWRGGRLTHRWTFDTNTPGGEKYAGQGNHNLSVGDVDGDGKDEIVYGQMGVDDNGTGLYTTGLGHGDAMHLTDVDPARPGLEVFSIQERFDDAGAHLVDARTGEVLWKKPSVRAGSDGEGPGRALALDIDPRYPGLECWVAGAGITGLFDARGNKIADQTPPCNMGVYWDGDLLREILNNTTIGKWDYAVAKMNPLLDARDYDCVSNNGTKATPCLSADILGDWREEVIWRTRDNKELRIFTTTIPTNRRFVTFMHDPVYRLGVAWQNVAYNQPPHTSFYLGAGMAAAPANAKPTLFLVGDSTVRNGTPGQQGWGDPLAAYFDAAKITVVNRAIGGRSSRTFQTEKRWDQIRAELKPGDFVLIQFGHNDGGPLNDDARARGTIRGTGEETQEIDNLLTKNREVVHTYGWYLRKFIADAKAKGAVPIICSPVPRNIWKDNQVARAANDYGKWARESAQTTGAAFVDLNEIIARRYESLGPEKVGTLFGGDHTHTNPAGAEINAAAVVEGLKRLVGDPLRPYFAAKVGAVPAARRP